MIPCGVVLSSKDRIGVKMQKRWPQDKLNLKSGKKTRLCLSSRVRVLLRADLHSAILAHATNLRQAYDMTYDCRSVLKHVLKC